MANKFQEVEAFGQILEFPEGMSHEDMRKHILANEHILNPNYKQKSNLIGDVASAAIGQPIRDAVKNALGIKDSKSISEQAEETAGREQDAASPNVPGVPVRQSAYNRALLDATPAREDSLQSRIQEIATNDAKGIKTQRNIQDAMTAPVPAQKPSIKPRNPDGGFANSVMSAAGQGFKGVGRAAIDYLDADKDNWLTRYGEELIKQNPLGVKELNDIKDKPFLAAQEATGNAVSSIGAMAGVKALGMGISTLSPLTGPLAPVVFATGKAVEWLGPAAIAALPSYGSIRDKQILKDPNLETDARAKAVSALGSIAVGAIEAAFGPQQWALSMLTKEGRAALSRKFASTSVGQSAIQQVAVATGKGVVKGGLIEGAEELVQNPIEQLASYDDPTTKENIKDTLFGGAMGAIGGGVVGGAISGANKAARNIEADKLKKQRAAARGAAQDINARDAQVNTETIMKAQSVDEAIEAGKQSASKRPVTANDVLRTTEPTLADIERLTGLKPVDAIDTAIQEAGRNNVEPQATEFPSAANEIVLPDNTSIPFAWDVVDADQVKATLQSGVNQPRDRTRAASDVQIQSIANNPDYRRLSDSPVMDVGAPVLTGDNVIVAGNGRFEGVSRAYEQGAAESYRKSVADNLQSKGIDPAIIDGMSKPVLIRRVTKQIDIKSTGIQSNSGQGLQYSGMELAGIDADRMKGIENIEYNELGEVANNASNHLAIKELLSSYNQTEIAALQDANGRLSQDGLRRIRNATLAKAYGKSNVLSRLIETNDNNLRNILGALTRTASTVAKTRARIAEGSLPQELDITDNLLEAIDTLHQLKVQNIPIESYLAQQNIFNDGIGQETQEIMIALNDAIRSQKKLAGFIYSAYDSIGQVDASTDNIFGDNSLPSKKEVVTNAKNRIERAESIFAATAPEDDRADQKQSTVAANTAEGGKEGQREVKPLLSVAKPKPRKSWYYSQLAKAMESAKQNVMPGKEWALWLQSNKSKLGIKDDELHWTGVIDWLDSVGRERVTREQVVEYLDKGGVQLQETALGDHNESDLPDGWTVLKEESGRYAGLYVARDNRGVFFGFSDDKQELINNVLHSKNSKEATKYHGYKLKDGTNYREFVLTLPRKTAEVVDYNSPQFRAAAAKHYKDYVSKFGENFVAYLSPEQRETVIEKLDGAYRSSHWPGITNPVAHMRVDTVEADGKKYLRVIEVQSDWGQKGRKKGFGKPEPAQAVLQAEGHWEVTDKDKKFIANVMPNEADTAEKAIEIARLRIERGTDYSFRGRVPSAPFVTDTKAWTSLIIKRAISLAAQEGMDGVVFANGQEIADLYDLSKNLDSVEVRKIEGSSDKVTVYGSKGNANVITQTTKKSELADVIGKELAEKALHDLGVGNRAVYSGLDLKVGGEGMRSFYDQIIPQVADDVLKKVGAGVKVTSIDADKPRNGFVITPEFAAKVNDQGLPLFSKKAKTQEDQKNLFVAHNLTADNIRHADELGGLAAPSLAIANKDNVFAGFGEITLIANPEILKSGKVRTFDADVYSPRHPNIAHEINRNKFYSIKKEVEIIPGLMRFVDSDDLSKSDGKRNLENNPAFRYFWLKKEGIEPAAKQLKLNKGLASVVKIMRKEGVVDGFEARTNVKIVKALDDYSEQWLSDFEKTAAGRNITAKERGGYKNGLIRSAIIESVDFINKNGIDVSVLIKDTNKKIDQLSNKSKFTEYAASVFSELVQRKRIFKGFTYSGNRRYVPYNMDNILREMTSKIKGGEGFMYGAGNVRAAFAKEYKTISQIQKDRGRVISSQEMDEIKKESQDRVMEALDQLRPYYKHDASSFRYFDDALNGITEGRKGWREAFNLNSESEGIITGLIDYLTKLPTEYFEAKAQRAVGLNEFRSAVVPKDTPQDVINILKKNSLGIHYYKKGDNESRRSAVESEANKLGVLFSFAGQKSQTANKSLLEAAKVSIANGESKESVRKDTGWFKGADGKWRYEIDDSDAVFIGKDKLTQIAEKDQYGIAELNLIDVIQHEKLFRAYPQLKNTKVFFDPDTSEEGGYFGAHYDPGENAITLGSGLTNNQMKSGLLHEIQHIIQLDEGFATGGSSEKYTTYNSLYGEIEARNTQSRSNLSEAQRRDTSPESTQDIPDSEAIVTIDGNRMDSARTSLREQINSLADKYNNRLTYGEVVVLNNESELPTDSVPLKQKAWHGSPHDHDKFMMDKIGTGEVAQAYGYGLYMASSREVAEYYRNNLSGNSGMGALLVGVMPPPSNKSIPDIDRRNIKNLAKLLVPNPGVTKLFSEVDVVRRSDMLSMMRGLIQDNEVRDSVIRLIPIDVVNMLSGKQISTEMLRHNPSMLINLFPRNSDDIVPGNIFAMDILAPAVAISAAKVYTGLSRFNISPSDFNSAFTTNSHKILREITSNIPYPREFVNTKGKLYEVELKPQEDEYLLWDKPLSEQSEKVLAALKKLDYVVVSDTTDSQVQIDGQWYARRIFKDGESLSIGDYPHGYTGEQFYAALTKSMAKPEPKPSWTSISIDTDGRAWSGQRAASKYLHSLGIKGIKYLDGTSRSKGEGSYSYILFSEDDIEIKAKYSKDAGEIEGAYIGNGKAYVIANAFNDIKRVDEVIQHELSHLAAEELLDGKEYKAAIESVKFLEKAGNKVIAKLAFEVDARQPGLDADTRAKEILALAVETGVYKESSVLKRIVSDIVRAFKAMLRKLGVKFDFVEKMTEREVFSTMRQAMGMLYDGNKSNEASAKESLSNGDAKYSAKNNNKVNDLLRRYNEINEIFKDDDFLANITLDQWSDRADELTSIRDTIAKEMDKGLVNGMMAEGVAMLSQNTSSKNPWRITYFHNDEPTGHSEYASARKALNDFMTPSWSEKAQFFSKVGGSKIPKTLTIDGKERPTRNSNSQLIHPTEDGIRNFWRWFGDSEVVDEQGRPLVVYHGTAADFAEFGADFMYSGEGASQSGSGFYFTTNMDSSSAYSLMAHEKSNKTGGMVMPVYLALNNPMSIDFMQGEVFGADVNLTRSRVKKIIMSAPNIRDEDGPLSNFGDIEYEGFLSVLNQAIDAYAGENNIAALRNDFFDNNYNAWLSALSKATGFDSAMSVTTSGDVHYVAWQPNQIKSATGNTGAFSKKENSILLSRAKQTSKQLQMDAPKQETDTDTLPEETKFRKFQREWQDDFNRFQVIKDWMAERGTPVSEKADVSLAEERFHARVANQIEDFKDFTLQPLIGRIADAGFSMQDVADFLEAQHAKEANAQIRELRNDPEAMAYGVSDEEAQTYLDKAAPELKRLSNEFRNITEAAKRLRLDNGIILKETTDAWESVYKYYIPVKGGDQQSKGTGKGLSVAHKDKRRLGHGRRDESVIENIIHDYERAVFEAEKNRVGKHLVMMAAEIGMPEFMTIGQPVKRNALRIDSAYEVQVKGVTRAVFDTREAATAYKSMLPIADKSVASDEVVINKTTDQRVIASASPMLADNEINVYIDGHAIRLQINDELSARAYKKLGIEGFGKLVAAGRAINGYLSKVYTGYNPEFILTNVIRDFTSGIINLTGEEGGKKAAKAIKNYPGAMMDLLRYAVSDRKKSTKWIDMYRASGGNTGAAYLSDMERVGADVAKEYAAYKGILKNLKEGQSANAARAAGRKVFNVFLKWIYNMNQAGENAMRLAAFKAMIESGNTVNQAAHVAKNITVNFNRKGENGQIANAAYLFFNASVQGHAAMSHALFKGKHKGQAWALGAGMVTLGYIAAASLGFGDDDDKEYDKIDDYTKERNLIIKSGDGWLKIPVPYGYGFFFNLGRAIADAQRGEDLGMLPWHVTASAIEELTPFGDIVVGSDEQFKIDQVMMGFMPTAIKIPSQVAFNKQLFSGGEIMPEREFVISQPDRDKMYRGTKGTVYDDLAGLLESAGLDVSPESLKYSFRTATGGLGALVDTTISAAMLKSKGAELETAEIPFVRKLYHENTIKADRAAFHKARKEAQIAAEEFSRAKEKKDFSTAKQILVDKNELIALDKYADKLRTHISAARDRQDAVRLDPNLTVAEKRAKLKMLEKEESAFYDKYLDVFNTKKAEMKRRIN